MVIYTNYFRTLLTCANVEGLSVGGELVVSRDSDYSASGIVIRLCVISFTPEGAWFFPERNLPSTINGDTVTSVTLLSKGWLGLNDQELFLIGYFAHYFTDTIYGILDGWVITGAAIHIADRSLTFHISSQSDVASSSSSPSPSLPPRKPQRGPAAVQRVPSFLEQLELSSEQWRKCQDLGDQVSTLSYTQFVRL